ncbi:MAG: permease-like cell division protein FtsX, partial [Oscillospiraceae bacterium]|nr:permease-like cell division protein FtsX [Oscillospiraceae bacterium]
MGSSFKYLIREGFRNMWTNRLMSSASIGVLICCLVLMGSATLVSVNVSSMMGWLGRQNVVMVFMDDSFGGSESEIEVAKARLEKVGNVKFNSYVPRDEAYKNIISRMNHYEMLNAIDDAGSFLPDAFTLTVLD